MGDKENKDDFRAEMAVTGLLALQPPGPDVTDPVEWLKRTTLFVEQLYQLQKLQFEVLKDIAAIVVSEDSPYSSLIAAHALCLMALKSSGKLLLTKLGVEPLNLLDEQKAKARELLSSGEEIPEPLRNALLKLLGTEEGVSDDDEFFPSDGITIPFDSGKVH